MLESDFELMFPNKQNKLFDKCPEFSLRMRQLLNQKNDSFIKEKINSFEQEFPNPEEADKQLFCFQCLPLLLQSPNKGKMERWKPSKQELMNGFILQIEVNVTYFAYFICVS